MTAPAIPVRRNPPCVRLRTIAFAYVEAVEAYARAMRRGDIERADEGLARMQQIEASVTVVEIDTKWRRP